MTTPLDDRRYDGTAMDLQSLKAAGDGRAFDVKSLPWLHEARGFARSVVETRFAKMKELRDSANGREFTRNQQEVWNEAEADLKLAGEVRDQIDDEIEKRNYRGAGFGPGTGIPSQAGGFVHDSETRDGASMALGETRMADYVRTKGMVPAEHEGLSLRKFLRGAVTGEWNGAESERRALAEGSLSSGGVMVPTPLSATVIDQARNASQVIRAGAQIVPMASQTLTYPRLVTDPTVAWHTENATISPSDPVFEAVVLKAKSLAGQIVMSRELLEDAVGGEQEIVEIFGKQFALALDRAALYGSGTDPEPRGVKNATNVTIQSMGTNGLTPTNYNFLIDAIGTLADNNFDPTSPKVAALFSARTWRTLAKMPDSTGQPLRKPDVLTSTSLLATNQIGNAFTQGSASTASDAFVAKWDELIIGMRTQLQIQVLHERYADTGSIGLIGWMRADILVARPKAFVVVEGLLP